MKIAVIDNFDSFVFNLVRYLKEETQAEIVVMRNDVVDYSQLDDADAILLSPGPGIPSEAGDLKKVIEKYHLTKRILGVCLGHQAIGEFFGAELIPSPEIVHGKASDILLQEKNHLFYSLPDTISVGRYHSWQLSNRHVPDSLHVTALTKSNEIMAIRHRELPVFGVQFHPESILTPTGRTIINNWINA